MCILQVRPLENKCLSANLQKNRKLAKSTKTLKICERDINREARGYTKDTAVFCSRSVYCSSKGKRDWFIGKIREDKLMQKVCVVEERKVEALDSFQNSGLSSLTVLQVSSQSTTSHSVLSGTNTISCALIFSHSANWGKRCENDWETFIKNMVHIKRTTYPNIENP